MYTAFKYTFEFFGAKHVSRYIGSEYCIFIT